MKIKHVNIINIPNQKVCCAEILNSSKVFKIIDKNMNTTPENIIARLVKTVDVVESRAMPWFEIICRRITIHKS
jgi:hypothetical protein